MYKLLEFPSYAKQSGERPIVVNEETHTRIDISVSTGAFEYDYADRLTLAKQICDALNKEELNRGYTK